MYLSAEITKKVGLSGKIPRFSPKRIPGGARRVLCVHAAYSQSQIREMTGWAPFTDLCILAGLPCGIHKAYSHTPILTVLMAALWRRLELLGRSLGRPPQAPLASGTRAKAILAASGERWQV